MQVPENVVGRDEVNGRFRKTMVEDIQRSGLTEKKTENMKYMSKRFVCIALCCLAFGSAAYSQKKDNGSLTPDILKKISGAYKAEPSDKAISNALAATSISVLATNSENAAMIDTHFSVKVPTKGITDQKSSGRCWLFTGLNVLRAKMIDKYDLPSFEFSQNYLFFYDQLEKSNLFLQGVIDSADKPFDDRTVDWLFSNPLSDGGQFTGVSDLISKYGVVPSEAMPERYSSNNTSQMSQLLKLKLREGGLKLRDAYARKKPVQPIKVEILSEIYRMLALCLGVPPTEFEWTRCDAKGNVVSVEKYTPKSFYDKYVGEDLENNYVMIMNDPCREYGKVYEIEYDRHCYDGKNWLYVNLPVDRIKEIAIASLKDSTAMYFSCDVGKFFSRTKGTLDLDNFDYESLFGVEFPMDKKQRVMTHASGSSHAMTLIATDLDADGKPLKWMVENSWGPAAGYKGCLIMTDKWFDEYMFRLVAEKKYIPSDILEMMNQTPVKLPAWDPMFQAEE